MFMGLVWEIVQCNMSSPGNTRYQNLKKKKGLGKMNVYSFVSR